MNFQLCEDSGFYLRMGLIGPSGSGKSFTALRLATSLGFERIGIIDTENRSARRYARCFRRRFQVLELDSFAPTDYIAALKLAADAGLEVVVLDSLSHAWMGRGGVLEMVDQSARRQSRGGSANSFSGWREVTPEHNRLVDALIRCPFHLIVTMRVKTDYVVEKDEKTGKSAPRKVGLAPVQREGLEYEFDLIGDITPEQEMWITKSRCPALTNYSAKLPGEETAKIIRAWLDGGGVVAAPASSVVEDPPALTEEQQIAPWLDKIAEVGAAGSAFDLDALRADLSVQLPRRSKYQGDTVRAAIEQAAAAIHLRDVAAAEALAASQPKPAQIEVKPKELIPATLAGAFGRAADRDQWGVLVKKWDRKREVENKDPGAFPTWNVPDSVGLVSEAMIAARRRLRLGMPAPARLKWPDGAEMDLKGDWKPATGACCSVTRWHHLVTEEMPGDLLDAALLQLCESRLPMSNLEASELEDIEDAASLLPAQYAGQAKRLIGAAKRRLGLDGPPSECPEWLELSDSAQQSAIIMGIEVQDRRVHNPMPIVKDGGGIRYAWPAWWALMMVPDDVVALLNANAPTPVIGGAVVACFEHAAGRLTTVHQVPKLEALRAELEPLLSLAPEKLTELANLFDYHHKRLVKGK